MRQSMLRRIGSDGSQITETIRSDKRKTFLSSRDVTLAPPVRPEVISLHTVCTVQLEGVKTNTWAEEYTVTHLLNYIFAVL